MEIRKVYKESIPDIRLIGRRYTNKDRDVSGTFSEHWQEWFQKGWFEVLKQGQCIPGVSEDCLGVMRMSGLDDEFEYWIGSFFAPESQVPEGFDSVEIGAGEVGVCWLYGNEQNGELYGCEASELSMKALTEQGWKFSDQGWFFERYNCPRFTEPDEKGNVVLDICAYLI